MPVEEGIKLSQQAIQGYLDQWFPVEKNLFKEYKHSLRYDLDNLPVSIDQARTDARQTAELGEAEATALFIALVKDFEQDLPTEEKTMTTNTAVMLLMIAEATYLSTWQSHQNPKRVLHQNRFRALISFVEI